MVTEAPIKPFKPLRQVNKKTGKLTLNFHRGQLRVWDSVTRFVFMLAGVQGGKSSFIPHWLFREIEKARDKLVNPLEPGEDYMDFAVVTSTYDMFHLKLLPEMRAVFVDLLQIARYWEGSRVLELRENLVPNGKLWAKTQNDRMWGRIMLRSAEALSGLESLTAKAIALDEVGQKEFTLQAWEAVVSRLSLAAGKGMGRVLGATSLYQPGWLKFEVFDPWMAGDDDFDVIQFDSTDNPAFSQQEFDRQRAKMPAWKFDLRYRGRYAQPVGLIYDCFDEAECVIDRFPIPDGWLWYVGHDFGGANPAALIYAQNPATAEFFLVHEYVPGPTAVTEQVAALQKLTWGRTVISRKGGSHQEQDSRQNYAAHGWPIAEPSVSSVDVGIERVYELHKLNRIKVFRDNKGYLDEILSYSRKLGPNYQVLDEIDRKSQFHRMDCFVKGSMILTEEGEIPIEDVAVDDYVLTREGLQRVTASELTRETEVWEASFSDGTALTATSEHPFWVNGKGWVPLNALRHGDTMETSPAVMQRPESAPADAVRFLGIRPLGRAPVYNLSVDSVPEYYANGILVHNCERYTFSGVHDGTLAGRGPKVYHSVRF